MKKMTKIVGVMAIVAMLLLGMATISSATNIDPANIANGLHGTTSSAQGDVMKIGNDLIGIITTVGVVVAVIVLLILGIKYMMGSASEKAEYKKTMLPYLVGAVLIFGASAITKVIVSLASSFNG